MCYYKFLFWFAHILRDFTISIQYRYNILVKACNVCFLWKNSSFFSLFFIEYNCDVPSYNLWEEKVTSLSLSLYYISSLKSRATLIPFWLDTHIYNISSALLFLVFYILIRVYKKYTVDTWQSEYIEHSCTDPLDYLEQYTRISIKIYFRWRVKILIFWCIKEIRLYYQVYIVPENPASRTIACSLCPGPYIKTTCARHNTLEHVNQKIHLLFFFIIHYVVCK